jgi:hypothetical protein
LLGDDVFGFNPSAEPKIMISHRKRRTVLFLGLILLVAYAQPLPASDEAYLRALEMEAAKVDSGIPKNSPDTGKATTESRRLFERNLENHYASTFQLCEKLPIKSRREIFEIYQTDKNADPVRREVIERLLQS